MRCGVVVGTGVLAVVLAGTGLAYGQEVVHALSGTVTRVDQQAGVLQVKTNDGSEGTFNFSPKASNVAVSFDRDVKGRTTPVSAFNKPDEQVVVYYYGNGGIRTAVAVQDLGPGPFETVEGTVTRFDRHQHEITVKSVSGQAQTFRIDPKAMADSVTGAVPGDKFSPSKGDNVRVIATKGASPEAALFIRD